MTLRIYKVDAFTDKVFSGNPAAVCPLDSWPDASLMQGIAMENNLAETAFYVPNGDGYEIRWFTPTVEVDLCGHATLAAALVLFQYEGHGADVIRFHSPRSGALTVRKLGDDLALNFPVDQIHPIELSPAITAGLSIAPVAAFRGRTDYMFVYEHESQIRELQPDFDLLVKLDARGVIITAQGVESDFVSRFFGPQSGINEDPVTGSAHTTLTPYWAERLGKHELTAIQLSPRRGYLSCSLLADRVDIRGKGRLYLRGEIYVD